MLAWCVVRGAWCVVRGAWCVVRGAWCVVRGAWCVVRGAWCVVRGAWCVVRGAWCVARGAWCVVRGAWCVVRGAWCVVRGAWCVVRGAWCVVRGAWRVARGAWRVVRGVLAWCARVACSRGVLAWRARVVCSRGVLAWYIVHGARGAMGGRSPPKKIDCIVPDFTYLVHQMTTKQTCNGMIDGLCCVVEYYERELMIRLEDKEMANTYTVKIDDKSPLFINHDIIKTNNVLFRILNDKFNDTAPMVRVLINQHDSVYNIVISVNMQYITDEFAIELVRDNESSVSTNVVNFMDFKFSVLNDRIRAMATEIESLKTLISRLLDDDEEGLYGEQAPHGGQAPHSPPTVVVPITPAETAQSLSEWVRCLFPNCLLRCAFQLHHNNSHGVRGEG